MANQGTLQLHHLALRVSNYERAKDFYTNKLGFDIILEQTNINLKVIAMENRTLEDKTRIDILHQLGRDYVTEGLGKKDFDAIPYDENVSLRAPILPGGSEEPLSGKENLRTLWWKPLPDLIEGVKVFDTFVNKDLTQVTVEFHCFIKDPKCTLRIIDRFNVDGNNNIIAQENFFGPRKITNSE